MIGPSYETRRLWHPNIYYVDAANGLDTNDGFSWARAKLTIQAAMDLADDHDLILLRGDFTETVTTDDITGDNYITIEGAGSMTERGLCTPKDCSWKSGAADEAALTVNGAGYRIRNIRFEPNTAEAAIKLFRDTGNNNATSAIVEHCMFWGNGLYGIDLAGSPSECFIRENTFAFLNTAGGAGIGSSSVGVAYPYECVFERNLFRENLNHVNMYANSCLFLDNIFQDTGHVIATTYRLRFVAGNDNMVHGSKFGGTYSQAGGYVAGTNDDWFGNWSKSTGLAEVSDAGLTIDIPGP